MPGMAGGAPCHGVAWREQHDATPWHVGRSTMPRRGIGGGAALPRPGMAGAAPPLAPTTRPETWLESLKTVMKATWDTTM